jgi:hypothetical protein
LLSINIGAVRLLISPPLQLLERRPNRVELFQEQGVNKEQGTEFLKILNKISRDQLDPKLVLNKLDEIEKGVSNIQNELTKKKQQEEEAERIKHTAPMIQVWLTGVEKGNVMVHVKSENLIPFEYNYKIVTENNLIVSAIPTLMSKLYPTASNDLFYNVEELHSGQITNNYLELRFRFMSLSYEELQLPGHAGTLIRKYRIEPDDSLTAPD